MTHGATGKEDSTLDAGDSVVGREYVVVEKQTVEVNALADGQSSVSPDILDNADEQSLIKPLGPILPWSVDPAHVRA
jgi:hypothetical protein